MFPKHMLDRHVFGNPKQMIKVLEDIKAFFPKIVIIWVVFI